MEFIHQCLEWLVVLCNFILKIDQYLEVIIKGYGVLTYFILFLIIFCETGLVITPLLPGDSLLFAAGALSARGLLDIRLLFVLIASAAILGDMVNYAVGRYFGVHLFKTESRFLKKDYIARTHRFLEKYGNKAIVFCRFVPIIRTFTPFVTGFGQMNYLKFMTYNIGGGLAWTAIFLAAGFFFGGIPVIRSSMTVTILIIIGLSLIPIMIELYKAQKRQKSSCC